MISLAHVQGPPPSAKPGFRNARPGGRPALPGKAGHISKIPDRPKPKLRAGVSKGQTPRYGVACSLIAESRRIPRFYALRRKLELYPKLVELQAYRRASAYDLRRASENRGFFVMRSNTGDLSWHK